MRRNFRFNLIFRVLLLTGLIFGCLYSYLSGAFLLTTLSLLALVIGVVISLIRYVEESNKQMAHFLDGIQYNDHTTLSMARYKGESFAFLDTVFQRINKKFIEIRAQKEASHQFLQILIESINLGIICFQKSGDIVTYNPGAQELLGKPHLVHLNSLKHINYELWESAATLKSGERKLLKFSLNGNLLHLAIQANKMKLLDQEYTFLTLQNIRNELEVQEFLAWQKLIRILTHEIMNSVAPIASLSATLQDQFEQEPEVDPEMVQQLQRSMGVIQRRSENLLSFTETYRNLTRIPPPDFVEVDLIQLVDSVTELLNHELNQQNIQLIVEKDTDVLPVQADKTLIEQVLINLLKNAIEATEDSYEPTIAIRLYTLPTGSVSIQISDNGEGIEEEYLDKIFVPFFTTKQRGSGIGLSLSRQIMLMHKGSIEIQSEKGRGTQVSLIF